MSDQQADGILVYVGTFTTRESFVTGKAEGILMLRLNPADGSFRLLSTAARAVNPSFLTLHPSRRFLYAVDEIYQDDGGAVSAYAMDVNTGALTFLNRQASHGGAPCHLSVESEGRYLLVSNYQTGSVAMLPIKDDGQLAEACDVIQHVGSSINPDRQQGPHAHCIVPDPTHRFAFVCDLGLDKIFCYRLDRDRGKLVPNDPPTTSVHPGAGPRHPDFHRNGRWVYAINELDGTLDTFAYDGNAGALRHLQTVSTLPADYAGQYSCADVHVAPSGRFVYGSNRGHDSLAVFAVDEQTGRLTLVSHTSVNGKTPRNFVIDPTGTWLFAANQDSDNIVTFRIDAERGRLEPTGANIAVPTPVCIRLVPA